MSEKKKFSPFDECSCFVYVKRQKEHNKISVCLSVWMSECLYVRTYVDFSCGHNNFRRSERIQTKFGECLLCMKCRSGIAIQSNTMILILTQILNRILIFTKTLRSDTKFVEYLKHMKNNFLQWISLCNPDPAHDPDPKKTSSEKNFRNTTKFHEYHQHIKDNYTKINYQMISWSWSWLKFDWIEELTQIDLLKRV